MADETKVERFDTAGELFDRLAEIVDRRCLPPRKAFIKKINAERSPGDGGLYIQYHGGGAISMGVLIAEAGRLH